MTTNHTRRVSMSISSFMPATSIIELTSARSTCCRYELVMREKHDNDMLTSKQINKARILTLARLVTISLKLHTINQGALAHSPTESILNIYTEWYQ